MTKLQSFVPSSKTNPGLQIWKLKLFKENFPGSGEKILMTI